MKAADGLLLPGRINATGSDRLKRILFALVSFSLAIYFLVPLIQSGTERLALALFLICFAFVIGLGMSAENGDILNPYYSVLVLYSLYSCSAIMSVVINNPGFYSDYALHKIGRAHV